MSDAGEEDITYETEQYDTEFDYNPEFEQLLKENGDHAQVYSILHQMAHIKYKHMYDMFNIPLIIMSAVIGFITGIGIKYEYSSIILGGSSVFVSIIKSIVSYMKLSERSENHRICSLQFGQISNEIKTELSLRRNQRQPAKILLDMVKVKYKNLMEVAQLLDNDVINRFCNKYLNYDTHISEISLPPVFSKIPGIKILGSNSDSDHTIQMKKNLERYVAEKQFERDHIETELKHMVALRAIKEKYRVVDRSRDESSTQDTKSYRYSSSPSRHFVRQNSLPDEPRSTPLSSISEETSQTKERMSPQQDKEDKEDKEDDLSSITVEE